MADQIYTIEGNIEEKEANASVTTPSAAVSAWGYIWIGEDGGSVKSETNPDPEGADTWESESMSGAGVVISMYFHDDSILYAGTVDGYLFKKTSSGAAWTQVGTFYNTPFNQIAGIPGGNIYIAAGNGSVYTSDGSSVSIDYTTGESSVKGIAYWKDKLWASTGNSAKIFAKDDSWWLADTLTGNSITYIKALESVHGKLVGVGDNGYRYEYDGSDWAEEIVSGAGALTAHAMYLDKEVIANVSGDLYITKDSKWVKEYEDTEVKAMATHKGKLYVCATTVDQINWFQSWDFENWSEELPSKVDIIEGIKRDGGTGASRQYRDAVNTNISGIINKSDYSSVDTRFQNLQKSVSRKEFKLWFDSDKYRYARKVLLTRNPQKPGTLQRFNLSLISEDPYQYANQSNFERYDMNWSGDVAESITQISGDSQWGFNKATDYLAIRQTFTAVENTVRSVTIKGAANVGSPTNTIDVILCDMADARLSAKTIASGSWSTSAEMEVVFDYAALEPGLKYYFLLSGDSADDSNHRQVVIESGDHVYQQGELGYWSGDQWNDDQTKDMYFRIKHCEKSVTVTNNGNAYARPQIYFRAESGDLTYSKIHNTDRDSIQSYFSYMQTLSQNGVAIFDSLQRKITSPNTNAAGFMSGDFLEFAPGDNTLKITSAPGRFDVVFNDTYL